MATYTIEQRIFILEVYFSNGNSPKIVQLRFHSEYNTKEAPSEPTINNLIEKFRRTGSVQDDRIGHAGRPTTASTSENVEKVAALYERSPQKSHPRAAQELGMARQTVLNIIHRDLKLFAYKIQTHQPIDQVAQAQRFDFSNIMVDKIENEEIDVDDIWFSDEAHFHLDGYVKKRNWRFWGSENPHFVAQKSLHPKITTMWAAISSRGLIGPFFIDGNITTELYKEILASQFIPILQGSSEMASTYKYWFQQDGARLHRTYEIFELLKENFGERVIVLDYPETTGTGIEWTPYSPDLNPCDFFLWGFLKDRVYKNNPQTIEDLKRDIQDEILLIQPETYVKVAQNFAL